MLLPVLLWCLDDHKEHRFLWSKSAHLTRGDLLRIADPTLADIRLAKPAIVVSGSGRQRGCTKRIAGVCLELCLHLLLQDAPRCSYPAPTLAA